MQLSQIFPRAYHPALQWLGTKDWLNLHTPEESLDRGHPEKQVGHFSYNVNKDALRPTNSDRDRFKDTDFQNAENMLKSLSNVSVANVLFLFSISKAMANGIKLFQPTPEQCLAFENTNINVAFDQYQQPFPVCVIELPTEYKKHLKKRFANKNAPAYIFSYKDPKHILVCSSWFNPENIVVSNLTPRKEHKDIEAALRSTSQDATYENMEINYGKKYADQIKELDKDFYPEENFSIAAIVQRLSLNFSLAMTMLGVKNCGPLNPKLLSKHRQVLKNSKDDDNKEKARLALAGTVYVVQFDQQITFYETEGKTGSVKESDSNERQSVSPHWRRGHMRLQPYGTKSKLRKLTFIKPVLVNKDNFIGDLSDTSTTYKGKKRVG